MNNACIVLQRKIEPSDCGVSAVLDAFALHGYSFSDVRFLVQTNEKSIKQNLQTLKENVEICLVLADISLRPADEAVNIVDQKHD